MARPDKPAPQAHDEPVEAGGVVVVVLTPIKYGGRRYAEGERLGVPRSMADALIAQGAAAPAPTARKGESS